MARTPFKLKGWSPFTKVKETSSKAPKKPYEFTWPGDTTKATGTKKSKTLSYKEAYKKADKSKYKTEAEFTTAAKAWNVKKYGTTEPTREAKKLKPHYSDVTDVKSGKKKLEAMTTYKAEEKARTHKETKTIRRRIDPSETRTHQKDIAAKTTELKTDVKGARKRGKQEIGRVKSVYGKGSAEIKAARKAKRQKVREVRKARRA